MKVTVIFVAIMILKVSAIFQVIQTKYHRYSIADIVSAILTTLAISVIFITIWDFCLRHSARNPVNLGAVARNVKTCFFYRL